MEMMRNSTSLQLLLLLVLCSSLRTASATSGPDNYGTHPRFVCTPLPADVDPSCFPTAGPGVGSAGSGGPNHQNVPPGSWWGVSEEAKTTILHLRESLIQQKEVILDQRETIRELTAKLALCEGFGRGASLHDEHHSVASRLHHTVNHHTYNNRHNGNGNLIPDSPRHPSFMGGQRSDGAKEKHVTPGDGTSPGEQMERMLQALKERLDNLQKRNTSSTYTSSLKELLQGKIGTLEEQLHHHATSNSSPDHHDDESTHGDEGDHHDDEDNHDKDDHGDSHHDVRGDEHEDHHDDDHDNDHQEADDDPDDGNNDDEGDHTSNEADSHSYIPRTGHRTGFHLHKLETMINQLHHAGTSRKKSTNLDAFQISFPMRTNYMYGRMKKTLMQEIFALTLCLWMKAGVGGPGLGTPFSYSAPGQANELVLIEWGNNPMELLIDDKAATLPLSLSDGKWHHVCVTWTTRDGQWEAYQDGVQRGSGTTLSPWHSIKPGGVFILGQEQDTLGGRFDATQAYIGEMSDLHMWSHVLSSSEIYSLASCGSHLQGDIIAWSETEVELHGGVAKYPFDPCH
ncbi:neuronal pentraxin-2 [Nothobranchius furzeri]|uniref:Neuronal pentraxin-1-like n=3 Tax=Nothobranchius furzeri TaxID=105023 RepID=A0A1A7ZX29_NOTFU|nr:neuronal pentraxin-1-like [Nothobranchius furzeri]